MSNASFVKMTSIFLLPCQTDELPLAQTKVGSPLRDHVLESVRQCGNKRAQVRLLKGPPDLGVASWIKEAFLSDILNLKVRVAFKWIKIQPH